MDLAAASDARWKAIEEVPSLSLLLSQLASVLPIIALLCHSDGFLGGVLAWKPKKKDSRTQQLSKAVAALGRVGEGSARGIARRHGPTLACPCLGGQVLSGLLVKYLLLYEQSNPGVSVFFSIEGGLYSECAPPFRGRCVNHKVRRLARNETVASAVGYVRWAGADVWLWRSRGVRLAGWPTGLDTVRVAPSCGVCTA